MERCTYMASSQIRSCLRREAFIPRCPSLGAHSSLCLLGPCLSLCIFVPVSSFSPNTPLPSSFGVLLRPFSAGAAPSVASLNLPGSSQVKVFSRCGLLSPPLDRPSLHELLQCWVLNYVAFRIHRLTLLLVCVLALAFLALWFS